MGIHTSVKAHINDKRVNLAVETDTVHEHVENETVLVTEPQGTDSVLETSMMSMASTSYGPSICDGNIPCLPMFSSAAKSMGSFGTWIKHDSPPHNVPSTPQTEGEILQSFKLMSFCFSEMKTATSNFHTDHMLSKGQTGRFYKGWIDEQSLRAAKPGTGMAVAIKKLKVYRRRLPDSKEWLTELNCSGQLAHPNLVKLIGYCLEEGENERLLVYEFMPQLSLDKHLLISDSRDFHCRLSWDLRMKIALGAAKGLAFLHSNDAKVMYGDFRSSKILLDSNYDAKLYGYGLAKVGFEGYRTRVPFEDTFIDDGILSWSGYEAPDYGRLTPKSDVYSFGVVLLDILSGKLAFYKKMPREERNLFLVDNGKLAKMSPSQGLSANKRKVKRIFDVHLEGQYSEDVAMKAINLAIHCLSMRPKSRPSMNEVVQVLEQLTN